MCREVTEVNFPCQKEKNRENLELQIKKWTMKDTYDRQRGRQKKTEKRQGQNEVGVCRIREDTKLGMLKSGKCFARLGIWQEVALWQIILTPPFPLAPYTPSSTSEISHGSAHFLSLHFPRDQLTSFIHQTMLQKVFLPQGELAQKERKSWTRNGKVPKGNIGFHVLQTNKAKI